MTTVWVLGENESSDEQRRRKIVFLQKRKRRIIFFRRKCERNRQNKFPPVSITREMNYAIVIHVELLSISQLVLLGDSGTRKCK